MNLLQGEGLGGGGRGRRGDRHHDFREGQGSPRRRVMNHLYTFENMKMVG